LTDQASNLRDQGASWHPAAKVLLGVVGAYVIFKIALYTIYFWDTEKVDYSKLNCTPPPKPDSVTN
jgi:hypothetical protein